MKKHILIIIAALLSSAAYAQKNFKLDVPKLPLLGELIDSAVARAPMRGYQVEREKEAQQLIKSSRRQWTEYMGVESYYRYGQLGVIDNGSTGGSSSSVPIVTSSNQSQSWWYVGAFIRLPIFAIANRAVEIERLRRTVSQAEYLQQDAADATTLKIIALYNEVQLNLEILQMKASLLETNNAQLAEAELLYEGRKIDLGRLAQLQEMQSKAATEFAAARYTARTSLFQMQTLTGVDIIGTYNFAIVKSDDSR